MPLWISAGRPVCRRPTILDGVTGKILLRIFRFAPVNIKWVRPICLLYEGCLDSWPVCATVSLMISRRAARALIRVERYRFRENIGEKGGLIWLGQGVGPLPQDSEQTSDGRLSVSELLLHILSHAGTAALLLLTMMKIALPRIKATKMMRPHWVVVGTPGVGGSS